MSAPAGLVTVERESRDTPLVEELQSLYARTRAAMGEDDLTHIRNVAAYGQAIDARRRELLRAGGPGAVRRAAVLEALYRLLQFSELGHNILHGSYDHLADNTGYHSELYAWDFNVDESQWKVMHHEGHHPYTNILGKDHDLGYSVVRGQPAQDWFGHHAVQLAILGAVAPFLSQVAPFLVANCARLIEGRPFWSRETLRDPVRIAWQDTVRRLITEPRETGRNFLPAMIANHVGGIAGYASVLFLVAIEHHAGDIEVFPDPGPDETRDEYYRRQIRGTRNFLRSESFDSKIERFLEEEVPFDNRPDFRVFYGGLDTHVEHHLFPDLPPNRQREIAPQVKEIALRHGLPYYETPIGETASTLFKAVTGLSIPVGEFEKSRPLSLLRRPAALTRRLKAGLSYRSLPDSPYLEKTRWYGVPVRVVSTQRLGTGSALLIRLEKPRGWDEVRWEPGAFLSLRVDVGRDALIRQYSLLHDSEGSDTMDICVKRVEGGRVSNALNDVDPGSYLTVLKPPVSSGGLAVAEVPSGALFIAGGVGITPILSQLRALVRSGNGEGAVLLYFNHDSDSVLFEREIRELAETGGISAHVFIGCRPTPELIDSLVGDVDRETFVCAPQGLVDAVRGYLADMGQAPERFHTESFAAPVLERPVDDGRRYTVSFSRTHRSVEIDGATTLLEAANRVGIRVPTGCRSGLCRACVTHKIRGVTSAEADGTETDRITVCDSLASSDVELDL